MAVSELTVKFGGLAAISDVTLSLCVGEIVGLIGPNGAGKTTLVNVLTGFQKPSSGEVTLNGHETRKWGASRFRREGVARTFQSGRLFGKLSVLENAEVSAIAMGASRDKARKQAVELLEWVGLREVLQRPAESLAYTDQRRLDIARALCSDAKYVLLDEPAAGMSDTECDDLMHLIRAMPRKFDCAVLLIEHNMHVVMGLSDRLHVLDGGRTIVEGVPAEVQAHEAFLRAYLGAEIVE
ncbi:ABC transporter ATP-binding protein [Rhizobium sp. Root1204]|nr:ABC transporter ATP-binding protein [Rhizobium sp. Root1204]